MTFSSISRRERAFVFLVLSASPSVCLAHGEESVLWAAFFLTAQIVIPLVLRKYIIGFRTWVAAYVLVLIGAWWLFLSSKYLSFAFYFSGIVVPTLYWLLAFAVGQMRRRR